MGVLLKIRNRFGKYAIKGLTKYIIITYVIGYLIQIIGTVTNISILPYLGLNPGAILHGQVWRLISWILNPPSRIGIFTLIMLFVYYQLGTLLERVWGDFFYNIFIFFGIFCTVIGAFAVYYIDPMSAALINAYSGTFFNTYYVSLSIFLGFAMTFPEQRMLFMFIIPIKIKYLAFVDIAILIYDFAAQPFWVIKIQVITSLASVIALFILLMVAKSKNAKRANDFKNAYNSSRAGADRRTRPEVKKAVSQGQAANKDYFHKCHICGQTDKSNPQLEFRYCSKCNGSYEYCQNHLFTHEHIN